MARPVVVVSNGHGTFELISGVGGGIAGSMSVDVALDVPGVTLSGTFSLRLNTTTSSRTVDGVVIAQGVKVTGEDVVLGVAGQRLTGAFTVEQNPTTKEVGLALDMVLELGNGSETLVTVGIDGVLVITSLGVAADLTAHLSSAPPSRRGSGTSSRSATRFEVTLKLNTGTAAVVRSIELAGRTYDLDVPPGPYFLVQAGSIDDDGHRPPGGHHRDGPDLRGRLHLLADHHRQGHQGRQDRLQPRQRSSSETRARARRERAGLEITDGTGAFLLQPGGIAGTFSAAVGLTDALETQLGGTFGATVSVSVNTLTTAVNDSVGGVTLTLPRGPYLRASVEDVEITFAQFATNGTETVRHRLSGDFLFEMATDLGSDKAVGGSDTAADTDYLTVAMIGLTLAKRDTPTSTYVPYAISDLNGVLLVISRGATKGYVLNLSGKVGAQTIACRREHHHHGGQPDDRAQRQPGDGQGRRSADLHQAVRVRRAQGRGVRLRRGAGDPWRLLHRQQRGLHRAPG